MADSPGGSPLYDTDAILRKAYFGAMLLCALFAALAVWGVVRYPHWLWAAPIVTAVVAAWTNQRVRSVSRRAAAVWFGLATLVLIIGSGVLLGVSLRLAKA
ncbi:hypothetical protein [Amycolatopsis sp. NPDC051903]|uniref:hypothetical protein n=1 Tax=Amycolatopsis sp. NPDC051903 TaxID=3363936 RepID=UPI003792C04B